MGAAYVCVKQAAWRMLAGNIPLLSPLLKAAMEHALTAYLLAGAATLPVLLLYPFGRRAAKDQLQCIGLVNHAGMPPDLLRKRRDKDNPRVTVWEFRNQSIPLQEWDKKRLAIETALGITIVKLTFFEYFFEIFSQFRFVLYNIAKFVERFLIRGVGNP